MNVRKILTKLLTDKANGFVVEAYSKNSISVNNYSQGTLDITKPGYYPIGVVGVLSSSSYIVHATCYLSAKAIGSATINYYVSNTSSSTRSTNITWYVLWAKMGGVLTNLRKVISRREVVA